MVNFSGRGRERATSLVDLMTSLVVETTDHMAILFWTTSASVPSTRGGSVGVSFNRFLPKR